MADPKIKLKRSSVEGKIPTSDQVPLGEIALNTYDGYLYASKNVGIGTTVIAINPFRVGTGTNTYNAYFTAGNIGIGTTNPQYKLHVVGNTNIDGTFTVNGAAVGGGDVVDDTTPTLGGTLETNGNLIQFGDSGSATDDRLQFGASQDLQLYHDGSNSYISDFGTGELRIISNTLQFRNTSDTASMLTATQGGSVELYNNGSKKFETTGAGVTITGICAATSFYGDGSNLSNVDADTLGGQSYFNWLRSNTEDFKTGGPLVFSDNIACAIGSNKDLEIYHNGTNNFIDNNRNSLYIRNNVDSDFGGDIYIQAKSSENSIVCQDDGEVQLYYDGSEKLNTSSTGVTITGTAIATEFVGNVTGIASTATTVQATENTTNTFYRIPFLSADTGNVSVYTDSGIKYNPSTNELVATTRNVNVVANNSADETVYLTFVDAATGGQEIETDTALNYNPSTNALTVGVVTGATYYGDGSNLTGISAGGISNIVEDTTPQLGGNLDVNAKNINFGDSASASDDRLNFGAGTDLSIYFNGTDSYIDVIPDATNNLYIRNNVTNDFGGNIYLQAKSGENSIVCNDDTSVVLYYDNAQKFYTTSTGVTVSGTGEATTWKVNDNGTFNVGSGDDLKIYHDGTDTYIDVIPDAATNNLYIRNNVTNDLGGNIYLQAKSGENSIVCNDDSSVVLYFDNAQKFYTTSTGVTVSGTGEGNWKANDNGTITAGTGDDFQIYHDGTDTYLDNDTGHLYIRNAGANDNSNIYIQAVDGENSILCADDSSVYLYYDNALKLQTTSAGVTITGTLSVTTLAFSDNQKMTFGADSDLQVYHGVVGAGSSSFIDNITGHLYIRNAGANVNSNIYIRAVEGENSIICLDDSSVQLYYDNNLKLATASGGINVTGTCEAGGLKVNDSAFITAGLGNDFQIYHDGTHTYLDNDTGNIYIRNNVASDVSGDIYIQAKSGENSIRCLDDAGVQIYYDNVQKFTTTTDGITVTGTGLGNWKVNDSDFITAGTGDDFQIYHDGTHTYLDNDTGNIYIRNNVAADVSGDIYIQAKSGENSIRCLDDAGVQIYYDNSEKLTTTSTGVTVTGALTATTIVKSGGTSSQFLMADGSVSTGGGGDVVDDTTPQLGGNLDVNGKNINFGDSASSSDDRLHFGASSDLEIYHNGSNSRICDRGTGNLQLITNSNIVFLHQDNEADSGAAMAKFFSDGANELYYNGTKRFETTSTGAIVSGIATATSFSGSGSNLTGLTGASAATYGDASNVAQIVVDSNGKITSISNVAISGGGGGSSLWTQTGYTGIGTTSAVGIGTIIEIIPYDTQNNGTLSFEGSAGQLFSITNQLSSGSIFSVNDVSGIPSIDVDADGTIQLAPFSSNESVGIGTTNPQYKLHVVGNTNIDGTFTVNGAAVGGGGGVTTGKAIAMAMVFG